MPVQADQGDEYAYCCPDASSLPEEGIDSPQYVLVQLQKYAHVIHIDERSVSPAFPPEILL
jgi:hypothetical protein